VSDDARRGDDDQPVSQGWPPPPPTSAYPPPQPSPQAPVWAAPSAPPADGSRPVGWPVPRASLHAVATWSVRLLTVVAVFQVLSVAAIWGTETGRSMMTFDPDAPPTFSTQEAVFALLSLLGSIPMVALVVVFLIWAYRCHVQLAGLGRGAALPYSPGMAVGCWFIPVVNLWMPLREVRGLFRASSPDRGHPEDPPSYLNLWWVTLVIVPFIGGVVGFTQSVSMMRDLGSGAVEPSGATVALNGLSTASLVIAAVLAIRLVRELTERVDRLAEEAGLR
jgi:hypothetical protein